MSDRAKGILCILASAFGFAVMAAFVRLCDDFGGPVSAFQKGFFRNVVALVIALVVFFGRQRRLFARRSGGPIAAKGWFLVLLRSLLGTCGIFANFYALSHITIAEGQTLNKTAPFFTVLFSWLFLGEQANWRQTLTLAVAFAGVVLVAKPGFAGEQTFPLVIGLLSGACAGSAYACVHKLGLMKVEGTFIVLFFSAFSCLASVPFMVHAFDPMTWRQVLVLFGAGAGAAVGQFGITAAYRFAEPRQIAVFDYSSILFASVFGFALFGQVPDWMSIAGFVIIIVAALRMRKA